MRQPAQNQAGMSWNSGSLWLPPLLGPFSSIRGLRLALEGCYFRKSRRSGSQSQDHHPALWGPGGRDPAAGQATLHSNTLGGPRAKPAPTVGGGGWGLSSKQASSHPLSQGGRNPVKRSAGKRGGGNANQSFRAPPSCGFQPVRGGAGGGRASLTHP